MIELDFTTPNSELASLVYDVASEIDYQERGVQQRFSFQLTEITPTIDLSPIIKELLRREKPDLDEATVNAIVEEICKRIDEEQRAKSVAKKAEKEQIRNLIKEQIEYNSQKGWELAFHLCGDNDDIEAKKLRYLLFKRFPLLSLEQIIKICEEFADAIISTGKYTQFSEEVFFNLSDLYLQIDSEKAILSQVHNCMKQFFTIGENKVYTVEAIIQYCSRKQLYDERRYWEAQYIETCLAKKEYPRRLLGLLLEANRTDTLEEIISKINAKEFTNEFVIELSRHKEYDLAETVLNRMEKRIRKEIDDPELQLYHAAWIEDIRFRLYYLRMGYTFVSNWTSIHFYDDIRIHDKDIESLIIRVQKKYRLAVSEYRKSLTVFELYHFASSEQKKQLTQEYVDAGENAIKVIPKLISFVKEIKRLYSQGVITEDSVYNIDEIINETPDRIVIANGKFLINLAVHYEKVGFFEDAIRICDFAIKHGYKDDKTKSGMQGRKQRLIKKQQEQESN